jgi:hypothetical protein
MTGSRGLTVLSTFGATWRGRDDDSAYREHGLEQQNITCGFLLLVQWDDIKLKMYEEVKQK